MSTVKVKAISEPAKYSSQYASSDNVVLLYCDEGTGFSYLHTFFQALPDDTTHWGDVYDTYGRQTPRSLDAFDFANGNQHYLVFDLNTGAPIDFYSELNLYYANKYEPLPTITFYD